MISSSKRSFLPSCMLQFKFGIILVFSLFSFVSLFAQLGANFSEAGDSMLLYLGKSDWKDTEFESDHIESWAKQERKTSSGLETSYHGVREKWNDGKLEGKWELSMYWSSRKDSMFFTEKKESSNEPRRFYATEAKGQIIQFEELKQNGASCSYEIPMAGGLDFSFAEYASPGAVHSYEKVYPQREQLDSTWQIERFEPVAMAHFRGLCAVNDSVVWASGIAGVVVRTEDAGKTWWADSLENCAKVDFRDIHAWDADNALVMAAGEPALMYRTEDGGQSWALVYENNSPGIFLDGIDFWDEEKGMAYGDPLDGAFVILYTGDGGRTWEQLPAAQLPIPLTEEAGFAASGTGIKCLPGGWVSIATGNGETARILNSKNYGKSWTLENTEMRSAEGCGIFSFDFWNEEKGILVGGCYEKPTETEAASAYWDYPSGAWMNFEKGTYGYRSCVRFFTESNAFASGRTGIDFWKKNHRLLEGGSWQQLTTDSYYSLSTSENFIYCSGKFGKIARISSSKRRR